MIDVPVRGLGEELGMPLLRGTCAAAIASLAGAASAPSIAATSIFVKAGATGFAVQGHSLSVSYFSPSGLSVQETNPLNGTTQSYSPSAAAPGLTAIDLAAAVNGTASGSATASADLATGIVRATAKSDTYQSSGTGYAELADDVTFTVAGGGSKQITVISHLDGTIGAFANSFSQSGLSYILNFGTASNVVFTSQGSQGGFTYSAGGALSPTPLGWDSYSLTNVTATGFDFTGLLTVNDGEMRTVTQRLNLTCQEGVDCDYSHTGSIALQLPAGVSFTSGSGVFLNPPSSVPAPVSWMTMIAGLGFGGAMARRQRARTARRPLRSGATA
jgi:hypothetical protein